MRYLEDEVPASVQGLAIFACSASEDWFEVGHFDAPFERNRLFISDRPHLYPLARLIDQYRRYAVVLADTNRAQIFVFASRSRGRSPGSGKREDEAREGWRLVTGTIPATRTELSPAPRERSRRDAREDRA